ncbi:MAG: hypothetical protein QXI60_11540 [Thermofilaceae archaeon]
MKIRVCKSDGYIIIKDDATNTLNIRCSIESVQCEICRAIMLGEDKPEYWTEVR